MLIQKQLDEIRIFLFGQNSADLVVVGLVNEGNQMRIVLAGFWPDTAVFTLYDPTQNTLLFFFSDVFNDFLNVPIELYL